MEKDISDYLEHGYLLALGDLNARTGSLPDFLMNYKGDNKTDLLYFDSDVEPNKRFNSDTVINDYGKKFLNMCINTDMLIVNGRTDGDIHGRFTYNSPIGNSTIDYSFYLLPNCKRCCIFPCKRSKCLVRPFTNHPIA